MITFLKLGGSLVTDKNKFHTARPDVIRQLAEEIRFFREGDENPLIIGHGSGSFGHIPAKKYNTRNGVHDQLEWAGFAEVHSEATALNRIVTDELRKCGLPVLSFVPMDGIRAAGGKISFLNIDIILESIANGLIPLIFGDTVFDSIQGGTILSTEDIFLHLCDEFPEAPRILLAGLEEGVWRDFPHNTELINHINANEDSDDHFILGSASTDVTGGMYEKIRLMKNLVKKKKAVSASIFSGLQPGNLKKALLGEHIGTLISRTIRE